METIKEIIDFIEKETDEKVKARTIRNWSQNGLIPSPELKFGGQRGCRAVYPSGTKEQALKVFRKLKENKDFIPILAELFKENDVVDITKVRKELFTNFDIEDNFKKLLEKYVPSIVLKFFQVDSDVIELEESIDKRNEFISALANDPQIKHFAKIRNLSPNDTLELINIFERTARNDPSIDYHFIWEYCRDFRIEPDAREGPKKIFFADNGEPIDNYKHPIEPFCDAIGLPKTFKRRETRFTEFGLLEKSRIIMNISHLVDVFNNITYEQLTRARNDFNIIENHWSLIKQVLVQKGLSVNAISHVPGANDIINPFSILYKMMLIVLISARTHYEAIIIPQLKEMSIKQRKERYKALCKTCPTLKPVFDAFIANTPNI
jgi:hypothetical protein